MASAQVEVLNPILLRSATPGPNEKVLQYLESMHREGGQPDATPPRSVVDASEYRNQTGSPRAIPPQLQSPAGRSKLGSTRMDFIGSPARSGGKSLINNDDEDADSNVQVGRSSEVGDATPPLKEPGPQDPPGPKYESYDSGPSFGNFGPLPADDHEPVSHNPFATNSWNPRSKTPSQGPLNGDVEVGQSTYAARIPLPPSEYAMSPRGTNTDLHRRDEPMIPPSAVRSPNGKERVLSPALRSMLTPEQRVMSPPLRSTKAASISPSDSPSQVRSPKTPSRRNTRSPDMGGEALPRSASRQQQNNGANRSQGIGSVLSGSHQSRPFSPYRHAPTNEDLLYAAIRGRSIVIPEEDEKTNSVPQSPKSPQRLSPSEMSKALPKVQSEVSTQANGYVKAPSPVPADRPPSVAASKHTTNHSLQHDNFRNGDVTPRARSPEGHLDAEETKIIRAALAAATPRTSYYAEALDSSIANHYHDDELCVLLRQEGDTNAHEVVKRALRKAIVQRVKKLGMKYDQAALREYKKAHSGHNPLSREDLNSDDPPQWAADIKRELVLMQQRIESLGPKIENLAPARLPNGTAGNDSHFEYGGEAYSHTPMTQTVHLQTQPTGTAADSMFQGALSEVIIDEDGHHIHPHHRHPEDEDEEDGEYDDRTEMQTRDDRIPIDTELDSKSLNKTYGLTGDDREDSTGRQYLEEQLYRLRQRPRSQTGQSHHTWEVAREHDLDDFEDERAEQVPSGGMPTIPDTNGGAYTREGSHSPPLPALPEEEGAVQTQGGAVTTPRGPWGAHDYEDGQEEEEQLEESRLMPWQLVHERLLSWAVIWPQTELDQALFSTTRGQQVDEVALSIWTAQTYKRYVRARLTDHPPGVVDRLFVPPNMADAISNAVYNGQHGNAAGMLRDLWSPFGLSGMPRLLVVLAKHRSETDHWVVHRFSLPDGTLMTYDSYSGRSIMDGRPLGWWFAIRISWPNANYPPPERLEQKLIRLHRPMQLPIDNSVAAAGIWRNILMGSRGERSLDLERLRDLINTEVKNLRQRKLLGRLSIGQPRQAWEHLG